MRAIGIVSLFSLVSLCMSQCGRVYQEAITASRRLVGNRTSIWPWMVSIHRADKHQPFSRSGDGFCDGTLIKEKYILTAAHCFFNLNHLFPSDYFVVMGTHDINEINPVRYSIKSIRLHENYDHNSYLNDIALLELSRQVNLTTPNIALICLPPGNIPIYPYESTKGIVEGRGNLDEKGSMSYTFSQIQSTIISNKDQLCVEQVSKQRTQFCAGLMEDRKAGCQEYSGGPLMISDPINCTWHIAGIVSYGNGCARADSPSVFTRVSVFMDWIEKYTNTSSILQISTASLWFLFSVIIYFQKGE